MSTAVNAPSDVRRRAEPIRVEDTPYLIPSFYDARWHNEHLDAVVTIDGVPVAAGYGEDREVLTVGMIPPWRRYALQDDSAEALSQDQFQRRHILALQEYVWEMSEHRETLAFPEKEPVQDIKHFLAWKRHPNEPSKMIPLGMSFEKKARRPEKFYDPRSERELSWSQLSPDQKERVAKALSEKGVEAPAVAEAAPVVPTEPAHVDEVALSAPCGKTVKSAAGLSAHMRHCDECQEAPEAA